MPKADTKTRLLACVPAPLDFVVPSRFPRKRAMVASWLSVGAVAVAVIALCSAHWLQQHTVTRVHMGNSGNATITTTGHYGLRTYSVVVVTQADTVHTEQQTGPVSSLLGLGALAATSGAVLTVLVVVLSVEVVAMFACFWHGWARWIAKATFFSAAAATFLNVVCSLVCFIMYVASVPKTPAGFTLGWGVWVCLGLVLLLILVLVLVLADKPTGFVRYQKGQGLVSDDGDLDAVASASKPRTAPSSSSSVPMTTAVSTRPAHTGQSVAARQQPTVVPHRPRDATPSTAPPQPKEVRLKALFDCTAEAEEDLSFKAGEILTLVSEEPGEGWLTARRANGTVGILPANYVTRV